MRLAATIAPNSTGSADPRTRPDTPARVAYCRDDDGRPYCLVWHPSGDPGHPNVAATVARLEKQGRVVRWGQK